MPHHQTPRSSLYALSVGYALSVFLADLMLPVGVAVSLAYIGVVLLAAGLSWWGSPALAALGCTGLTIVGWACTPPSGLVWLDIANRSLGLGALWIAVHLARYRQGKEEPLAQRGIRQTPHIVEALRELASGQSSPPAR